MSSSTATSSAFRIRPAPLFAAEPLGPKPESPLARYRRVVAAVLAERGARCECCGAPSRHVHHVQPCSEIGIASELVYAPENLMVLCETDHALFHPLIRAPSWQRAREQRGRRLNG